ncbi:MAG TPA: hypothetical protein VOA87_05225 [Thermoanaerobaculia bacterium]|nr:hypothetical protein [Thermoanaerobaculia bacterium]
MAKKIDLGSLDSDIARLYGLPLDEFTPARNALAAELKKAGQAKAAGEVKALAKPSLSAWTVNLLFSSEPRKMDALVAAGRRARGAQTKAVSGSGGKDLREAIVTVRALQEELRHRAVGLLKESGHNPGDAVVDRLATDLEALAFNPEAEPAAARRWLDGDLEPPGFEVLAGLQLAAHPARAATAEARPAPAEEKPAPRPRGPSRKETEAQRHWQDAAGARQEREEAKRREERERERKRLRDRIARAEDDLAKAKAEADARRKEADRAEKEVAEAERIMKAARETARAADETAGKASAALRQARRALEEAG